MTQTAIAAQTTDLLALAREAQAAIDHALELHRLYDEQLAHQRAILARIPTWSVDADEDLF